MSDIFADDILDAGQIGVLAGAGYQNVTVKANPKVCVFVTLINNTSLLTVCKSNINFKQSTMIRNLDIMIVLWHLHCDFLFEIVLSCLI